GTDTLLDRDLRVLAVEVVQVDGRDVQPAQARLAGRADVGGAPVDRTGSIARVRDEPALRGEDHVVPPTLDRPAHELLVGERAVDVRGVEEVHPQLESAKDRGGPPGR